MRDQEDIPEDASTLIRLGTITAVTLSPPRCRVRYGDTDDEGDGETPPIRWVNGRAGKTRTWSPPSEGEEVLLFSPDGQIGNAVALCGLSNDTNPPPSDQDVELALYDDGARISYDAVAHELKAILPAGATAEIEAPGGLKIKGPVEIEGDVTITGKAAASQDVLVGSVSLKDHVHGGVQRGALKSDAPFA